MDIDTLIIGGGPAGLTAACFSSGRTLVLDHMPAPARKLLATGGGRCNLTHDTGAAGIIAAFGRNGRFMAPALNAFPPAAIRAFFAERGVPTRAEPDGCVFPVSQKASDVAQALENAARAAGAEIHCDTRAQRIIPSPHDNTCAVQTSTGLIRARRVILATGGKSYPALGSDGSGFELAREAGLAVTPPVPALAGLFTRETWPGDLSGILLDNAALRLDAPGAPKAWRTGPVLFTHKGVSGPPAIDLSGEISARLAQTQELCIRLACIAERSVADWRALFDTWRARHGSRALHNLLSGELPRALALTLCGLADAQNLTAAQTKKETLNALATACAEQPLHITGTEGWHRAMVTRGGVSLKELNPATLACRRIPGLFCAGEVVDLDGRCGGYNLTWAFASGFLAGQGRGKS